MSDFIGFFIALFFLLVSALVRRREKREREEHPEKYKEQDAQETAMLKELLQGLDMQAEGTPPPKKKKAPPPRPLPKQKREQEPRRRVGDQYEFEGGLDSRHQGSAITERALDLSIDEHTGESHFSDKYEDVPHADVWKARGRKGASRAHRLLDGMKSKRDIIVFHEIIGPPKADQL